MNTKQTRTTKAGKPSMGYKAAVAAGKAICAAAARSTKEYSGEAHGPERWAARGACLNAIDELWYDHISGTVKEKLNYDRNAFMKLCGWPE